MLKGEEEDGAVNVKVSANARALVFVSTCWTVSMTTRPEDGVVEVQSRPHGGDIIQPQVWTYVASRSRSCAHAHTFSTPNSSSTQIKAANARVLCKLMFAVWVDVCPAVESVFPEGVTFSLPVNRLFTPQMHNLHQIKPVYPVRQTIFFSTNVDNCSVFPVWTVKIKLRNKHKLQFHGDFISAASEWKNVMMKLCEACVL